MLPYTSILLQDVGLSLDTMTWSHVVACGRNPALDLTGIIPQKVAPLSADQLAAVGPVTSSLINWMIYRAGPDHIAVKKAFGTAFNKTSTALMAPAVEEVSAVLIDSIKARFPNGRLDFMAEYARPLPALLLGRMLGIPADHLPQIASWTIDLTAFMVDFVVANNIDPQLTKAGAQAVTGMRSYFTDKIAEVRRRPNETILSNVVNDSDLDDLSLADQCLHIIFGGNKVPEYMAGSILFHCLKAEGAMAAIRDSEVALFSAIQEAARFESPVQFITRAVVRDITIGDKTLRTHDSVALVLSSANRDPRRFTDPNTFSFGRLDNPHIAFGVGAHTCVASQMVTTSMLKMMGAFLGEFKEVQLASPGDIGRWTPNATFHGLEELMIDVY